MNWMYVIWFALGVLQGMFWGMIIWAIVVEKRGKETTQK